MKAYRPKRITIRLTEEEHQALSELRSKKGGSFQAVVVAALESEYRLSDYAASIREHKMQQISYLLWGQEPDVPFDDDSKRAYDEYWNRRQASGIPV